HNAPQLIDHLGSDSKTHFQALCTGLEALNIPYTINTTLVRGLDYYGKTVFEWVTDKLGSQATICAGGRYDILVGQLGGPATPAVGFALGLDRILLLMEALDLKTQEGKNWSVYMIATSDESCIQSLSLAEQIRSQLPMFEVEVNTAGGSFKSQFKKADKSGA